MKLRVVDNGRRGLFVILLPTAECNLRCDYCFEDHPKGRWSLEQTRHVFEQIIELAQDSHKNFVRLHWQGGEAMLLGTEYFGTVLPLAEQLFAQASLGLDQTLQTNLLLYSRAWRELVHRHLGGFLGSSFEDGTGRKFENGNSETFVSAWAKAHRRALDDGISVGVICVLNDRMLDEGASAFLRRLRETYDIRRVRISLPFQHGNAPGHWVDPDRAGQFMADAYRFWVDKGRNEYLTVSPMQYIEDRLLRGTTQEPEVCLFAENCNEVALTIGHQGTVSLCDIFLFTEQADHFGNVFDQPLVDVYRGRQRRRVGHLCKSLLREECASCRYLPVCYGGCLVRSHGAETGSPRFHYCETYKRWFSAVEQGSRRVPAKPSSGSERALPLC